MNRSPTEHNNDQEHKMATTFPFLPSWIPTTTTTTPTTPTPTTTPTTSSSTPSPYPYPLLLLLISRSRLQLALLASLFLSLCFLLVLLQPAVRLPSFTPLLRGRGGGGGGGPSLKLPHHDGFSLDAFQVLQPQGNGADLGEGAGGAGGGAKGGGGGGGVGAQGGGSLVQQLVRRYRVDFQAQLPAGERRSPWQVAREWLTDREVLPSWTPELGAVLHALSTAEIRDVDNSFEGTQLKLLFTLAGGQRVVFKPKWYEREYILEGPPTTGRDRHNGEVAAFHLSRVLEFRRTPLAVGRNISVTLDLLASLSDDMMETFYEEDGETCFYGRCLDCSKENVLCTTGDSFEGVVILWLPGHVHLREGRNPWRRTYKERLMATWEKDEGYCSIVRQVEPFVNNTRLLLDLIDVTVFDFLTGNSDRHHYEVVDHLRDGMLVMLDNGKSFGNPYQDDRSILTPLHQCCIIWQTTWERLRLLQHGVLGSVLREVLRDEPLHPVLTEQHLQALDRRLDKVLQELDQCIEQHGLSSVVVQEH